MLEHAPGHAVDRAARGGQRVDSVAEAQVDEPTLARVEHPANERLEQPGPGAPGHVEARHGVAVARRGVAAALGPAGVRHPADALLVEPGALLTRGEVDVGLGPAAWPEVLLAIERRGAQPVLPGQL